MIPDVPMTSSRPYLLRALYDWIVDNGLTPYLLVDAEGDEVSVPRDYVDDGKIVLNVAPTAVSGLDLGNDWVMFDARFGGRPMQLGFPVMAVQAIYAKENGQGMVFEASSGDPPPPESPPEPPPQVPRSGGRRSHLKVVK